MIEETQRLDVPESIHCMCFLKGGQEIAVGMTDGNLLILHSDQVRVKASFLCKEIGGIWSVCGVNRDLEIAVGTISGIYILSA